MFCALISALALCPGTGAPPAGHPSVSGARVATPSPSYEAALQAIDFNKVRADLKAFYQSSQPDWPSDYGNYGPMMVRLAWHCSGSYRTSDGRGGCGGGRQRFDPERSWTDNTNLDKARSLLWPIKAKYGLGLSWGDLFILAGNTAVQAMGGPILGFCAGRVDDVDGTASLPLGPSPEQEKNWPCAVNGTCKSPLGSTTVGLIYLNPEGPLGQPLPEKSFLDIRDTFARMNMNDTETVALIGGGHAFGKAHGACRAGAGPSPAEDPSNPWPGLCGTGKGNDAFTSGFEGPWTTKPTRWDVEYFQNLLQFDWEVHVGPGGHHQWRVNGTSPTAPAAHGSGRQAIMMLTSDVSLTKDPAYRQIVQGFAADQSAFDQAWMHAWYKLTTRDMGPATRCIGPDVPPAQPWQNPLPPPFQPTLANWTEVGVAVRDLHSKDPHAAGDLVRLAWQCASTYRATDHLGGCNGARIRFAPENSWPLNAALDKALAMLEPIKLEFGNALSWADLIVLAGQTAIEVAGGPALPFCGGRTDAADGAGSSLLDEQLLGEVVDTIDLTRERMALLNLSAREYVALVGAQRTLGTNAPLGRDGAATATPDSFDNAYFSNLANKQWAKTTSKQGKEEYKAVGEELYMLASDLTLRFDPELMSIVQEYTIDAAAFVDELSRAWPKLLTADLYAGPTAKFCF